MIPLPSVALALADTLLSRPATVGAMIDGIVWATGTPAPWIAPLCNALAERTGEHFHSFSRGELAALIGADEAFQTAWESPRPPQILHYCIDLPIVPPAPAWRAALPLPDLPTVADLAAWLGVPTGELDWFADRWRIESLPLTSLQHYHYRWVAKRSGGWRLIEIPKARLRAIQRQLLQGLLDHVPVHPAAHGFRRGHSCVTHAALHAGQRVVIRMDLKNFFPSVQAARIHALFTRLGYSPSVAGTLARLCVNRTPAAALREHDIDQSMPWGERQQLRSPHLPQGSPCSPALANLCAWRLDVRLTALAASMGAVYSRYADDLAFSGGRALERASERFHVRVAAIAIEEGFLINTRKTRLMRVGTRQQLTGVVVNRHPNLARGDFDLLKAILSNCVRHGPATQNRDHHPQFKSFLEGKVGWVTMLNPARGARLRILLDAIDWASP